MKKQLQENSLFLLIMIFLCGFIVSKTVLDYRNLTQIETKMHHNTSVVLKDFIDAFRTTYLDIFTRNHIEINDTTSQFLPAVTFSQISEEFTKNTRSEITINTVTDRPRNPRNMADAIEHEAMQYFLAHPAETEYTKHITAKGHAFSFYASPLYISQTCLGCHGAIENVPPSIAAKYTDAYDYKEGELRGLISIKIHHNHFKDDLHSQFFLKTTITTIIGALLSLAIIFYLIRSARQRDQQYTLELETSVENKTKELREQINLLQEYSKVLNASAIVSKGDLQGKITYVNRRMCEVTGYSEAELLGQPHAILRHPDMKDSTFKNMWETIMAKSIWQGLVKNRKKDGSYSWAKSTICPILNEQGEIEEFIAARNDVTELVEKRQELQTLLTIDTLTSLPNRFKMLTDLKKQEQACVILIDVLDFADINDFFGIEAGDQILAGFAQRVQQQYSDQPFTLYKLHGDQLALLLTGDYQLDELKHNVQKLIESFNHTPFLIEDSPVAVRITCGIAWNLANPLLEADIALKQAKKQRKDYVIIQDMGNIRQDLEKNHNCTIMIKNALREQRVVTFYQPIVHADTGAISKYECLVRIIAKDGSVISPFSFLATAKKARIYTQITRAVIDHACNTFKNSPYDFSVNLSTEDIEDPSVVKHLKGAINHAVLADRVILEILETEGFENYEKVISFIREMKAMGCRIAIDDFGTGHSNYERLLNLHVDYLKIDGSIIKKITTDEISLTIVETIVAVAKKLKIKTVAEFVFDEATAQQATALGVDYLQGYYFSEPVAALPK